MNIGSQETSVGVCPICGDEFPMAKLCVHASSCNGKTQPEAKSQVMNGTGRFLSKALIFESTNPHYDDILFIELQVQ